MNTGEIIGELIVVLWQKGILNEQDVIRILGEKNFKQIMLTADFVLSGILTKEDLDNETKTEQ